MVKTNCPTLFIYSKVKWLIVKKKFNFVYLTINLINGKQYIGDHSTNNLNDNYIGSGVYFLNALNEHGKQNFKYKILEFFDTKEEAFDAQEKYIKKYNTLVPNGYNISPTGGLCVRGCHSEESRKKCKSRGMHGKKHSKETIQNIKNNNKGKHYIKHTKETKEKISKNHRKYQSEEAKEKMRKPKSIEHRKHISEGHVGLVASEKAKEKNRQKHLGKKQSEKTKQKRRESMIKVWIKRKQLLITCLT